MKEGSILWVDEVRADEEIRLTDKWIPTSKWLESRKCHEWPDLDSIAKRPPSFLMPRIQPEPLVGRLHQWLDLDSRAHIRSDDRH